jgi:hypothetical protein
LWSLWATIRQLADCPYDRPSFIRRSDNHIMNTKNIKDKAERKKLKREARNKRPPKPKRTEPRGSRKPKVKKRGPGAPPRR